MFGELADRMPDYKNKSRGLERLWNLELVITLQYLTTGEFYNSLMYGFLVPHHTISLLVR